MNELITNKIETKILNADFIKGYKQELLKKFEKVNFDYENKYVYIIYFTTSKNNYFSKNQQRIFNNIKTKNSLINSKLIEINPNIIKVKDFIELISKISKEKDTIGINIELPLPSSYKEYQVEIFLKINRYQDIDCLNPINYYEFLSKDSNNLDEVIIPSVANAVKIMLDYYNIDYIKKDIVILGNSLYTGFSIGAMFLKFGSSIYLFNKYTKDIKNKSQIGDILISSTGVINLVNKDYIKNGAYVIDVGFEVHDNKIYGDVNLNDLINKAQAVSIVPNGIGRICNYVALLNLYKNLVRANVI
jgi:methylenetetrahydrofolate dehydrogenase (NADP+)/methenyltetrahydrofolate cyclohydrolase